MEVIVKAQMPDGTYIQLEDWSQDYYGRKYATTLATYPIAKENSNEPFGPMKGASFRLEFNFPTTDAAKKAFEELVAGNKQLKSYKSKLFKPQYLTYI